MEYGIGNCFFKKRTTKKVWLCLDRDIVYYLRILEKEKWKTENCDGKTLISTFEYLIATK